jgi:hypothetical protein
MVGLENGTAWALPLLMSRVVHERRHDGWSARCETPLTPTLVSKQDGSSGIVARIQKRCTQRAFRVLLRLFISAVARAVARDISVAVSEASYLGTGEITSGRVLGLGDERVRPGGSPGPISRLRWVSFRSSVTLS